MSFGAYMSKPITGQQSKGGAAAARKTFLTVLHVDDDPNDTELLVAAATKAKVPFILRRVENAEQAIAYVSGTGEYTDRETYCFPALVLLDLKMPRNTGFEVLQYIRAHSELAHLPVVVLSGSELPEDIRRASEAGASSYLVKPLSFDSLVEMVKKLNTVWFAHAGAPALEKQVRPFPEATQNHREG